MLVTSTSPTKYGEGKTTLAISVSDALNYLGKSSCVVLREPSLGPVFGLKGGATGGGRAKILPEEEINLHFTGDIHAITTANNLLAAIVDNHIYQGNELGIQKNIFSRCLDLNDRSLRHVVINGQETSFNITTASEMMACFCLAQDEEDLAKKLGNIVVGYNSQNEEIKAQDLHCVKALMKLLKEAIKPNIVRTSENNLAIVHGGPFANVLHGISSVVAANYAISNFDYTLIEAGFGSDMGAIKYYDIVVRNNPLLKPDVVILNTTVQSLKYNGEGNLEQGLANLEYHIENMKKFTKNLLVVLNKHESDKEKDIECIRDYVHNQGIAFQVSTGYLEGSKGSIDVAQEIINLAKQPDIVYQLAYDLNDDLASKIRKFCKYYYQAKDVLFSPEAEKQLELLGNIQLPICVAKTQYSISDNKDLLGYPKNFTMQVKDIKLFKGAGFITVYFGNILTMPGLPKEANYLKMEE